MSTMNAASTAASSFCISAAQRCSYSSSAAVKAGAHYFDLTEDVAATKVDQNGVITLDPFEVRTERYKNAAAIAIAVASASQRSTLTGEAWRSAIAPNSKGDTNAATPDVAKA